jgi:hypothetical protein
MRESKIASSHPHKPVLKALVRQIETEHARFILKHRSKSPAQLKKLPYK